MGCGAACRPTNAREPAAGSHAPGASRPPAPEQKATTTMGDRTGISWTDATWNPQLGCSGISRGCQHCYAERQSAGRLSSHPDYEGITRAGRFTGRINLLPLRLDQPLRWKRPRRIFANSMSDLLHHRVEPEWIARVLAVMSLADWHQFQVLTKRADRLTALLNDCNFRTMVYDARAEFADHPSVAGRLGTLVPDGMAWPLPNVWWGVSIENN